MDFKQIGKKRGLEPKGWAPFRRGYGQTSLDIVRKAISLAIGPFAAALGVFLGIFFPLIQVHAQLPGGWDSQLCLYAGFTSCGGTPAGIGNNIDAFLGVVVIPAIKAIFIGVAIVYFAWYSFSLILSGGDEQTITDQRRAFERAAFGMGLVAMASFFRDTFAPSFAGATLVNDAAINTGAWRVIDYIQIVAGAFLIFIISLAGFRIIVLQGNDAELEKQRKNFFNGLLGVVILLVGDIALDSLFPSAGAPTGLVIEIAGMIKFLLEGLATLVVLALIVSGVFFAVSLGNDERRQRARRIISSGFIMLIVVIVSHSLIGLFVA